MLSKIRSWIGHYLDTVRAHRLDTPEIALLAVVRDYQVENGSMVSFNELRTHAAIVATEYFDWSIDENSGILVSAEFNDWVLSMEGAGYLDRQDGPRRVYFETTEKADRVLSLVESVAGSVSVYSAIDADHLEETAQMAVRSNDP